MVDDKNLTTIGFVFSVIVVLVLLGVGSFSWKLTFSGIFFLLSVYGLYMAFHIKNKNYLPLFLIASTMFIGLTWSMGKEGVNSSLFVNQNIEPELSESILIIPCRTEKSCLNILRDYYTDNEINEMGLTCESNICSISGFLDTGVV